MKYEIPIKLIDKDEHKPYEYTINKVIKHIQQGWECPKCGNVYNPSEHGCINCNKYNNFGC